LAQLQDLKGDVVWITSLDAEMWHMSNTDVT